MFQRIRDFLRIGFLGGRSGSWRRVKEGFILKYPVCSLCGGSKKLVVHHIKPFHLFPELELDEDNLITLCEGRRFINCHLFIGHRGNFKKWNDNVREDAKKLSLIL